MNSKNYRCVKVNVLVPEDLLEISIVLGFMQTLLPTQCSLHFDEHQKIKFIAYIYICSVETLTKNLVKALILK